jgi:phosphatidylserine synthase
MTAGNLFCGFAAVLRIYDGAQRLIFQASDFHDAIWFILAAAFSICRWKVGAARRS